MIKTFYIGSLDIDKFEHQIEAVYTGAFFEGCLLDNFVARGKRGFYALYEHYLNANSSDYLVKFAAYKDLSAVDALWSEFYEKCDLHEGLEA